MLHSITFIFTFFFLLLPSSSFPSSDSHTLLTLKDSFNHPDPALSSWEPSNTTAFCLWAGVKCRNGRVASLDLSDLNLGGSVSRTITRLDRLIHLSLSGNNFTGVADFFSNFTQLRYLNISGNQFSGGLHHLSSATLPNLEVLDAYDNSFNATLPLGVIRLSRKLKYLDLGGNYFYGEIPRDYGDFTELRYLSLKGNNLVGKIPNTFGNLTNLKELYLGYYNAYQGGIPKELGKLVNLVVLDLSNCQLKGTIPKELGQLKLLDTLYLYLNQLSGSMPRELGNLSCLSSFDVSINNLTGEIPPEFKNLKKIKLLNLFGNRLHGSIPDYVADWPDLQTLELWENNFTGTIPSHLGQNEKLQVLDLSSNKFTGTIPPNLCSSNQLRVLILFNNFLFGSIPGRLGACLSLTKVRLGHNFLNGSVPNGLIYLPQLYYLELSNNYLTGSLPENNQSDVPSFNPVKLKQLDLGNNLLSGHLPDSISSFSSVQFIFLGGNRFSGPIPPSVGQLKQIIKLDISKNNLSGMIPPEIGNCTHMNYLDLSQNNLFGPIPSQISALRIIDYLNLSRNHISGELPLQIGSMKSLTDADFSYNNLSGRVPETGQFGVFNASSFVGNPLLCGPGLVNNQYNSGQVPVHPGRSYGDFKLIFALAFLVCSLVFAIAAVVKARSFKRGPDSWKMTAFQKVDFTVSDILECMKDGNVIGRGGAGIVYHGKMPSGEQIAVKKLITHNHDHGFRAEIQTLGNIRHRYIVKLVAYCSNKHTNILIYEYMRNGSLGEALYGKKLGGFLGWNLRYKIATEAAKGLAYLHHDCSPLIVHRDVKSNNILLDSNFEAHVADFGLAKFLGGGAAGSECMSAIAGSYGYIAPEYAYTLRVDEKSDVYSYGVVLLELLTGRRPVGDFGEGVDIVQWTRQQTNNGHKDHVSLIVDSRLTNAPLDEIAHLFFVAMVCTQDNSVERPSMREVVQMLMEFPGPTTGFRLHQPPQRCQEKA